MVDGPTIESLRSEARRLRHVGLSRGLSNEEINRCIRQVLHNNNNNNDDVARPTPVSRQRSICNMFLRTLAVLVILLAILSLLNAYHKPTEAIIFRNTQFLIYPFMRFLRLSTLPLHSAVPQITSWHEDYCLVYNPFYSNPDLKCWPCEDVRMIVDLSDARAYAYSYCQNGVPFIIKEPLATDFTFLNFENFYRDNEEALTKGTINFVSSNSLVKSARDLFVEPKSVSIHQIQDVHIIWKFQRVWAARVLRTIFPRPYFVPNDTEVSLQRFIFIDGSESQPYSLPKSEFSNVWLSQKLGERVLTLMPSTECASSCSPISTVLMPGDILFYNWQYWKPRFLSARGDLSITYMGSYY